MELEHGALETLVEETHSFKPKKKFAKNAIAQEGIYEEAKDSEKFWKRQAEKYITWDKPFTKVLNWDNAPVARWFEDGKLNVAYNCADRHVEAGHGDRVAIWWEGEDGSTRAITYQNLTDEVQKAAAAFEKLGITKGDRVAIYLPMIPEAVFSMLACARLGAIHSVVFGGFSSDALKSRIQDANCKLVVTADGGFRKGKAFGLKATVDEALANNDTTVEKVIVVRRTEQDINWQYKRDLWWHETIDKENPGHKAEAFEAENPLFILYTSGTTGKPKGILHTSAGYLTHVAFTHQNVFDIHPESDVFWCTADIGWVTGHSYLTYGPLANGCTQLMYEGTPDAPHKGRWWNLVDKYKVTVLYTAPTAIRTFMKWGEAIPDKYSLKSLRVLGSVGEPINPEAWMWYRRVLGKNKTPIVDTWWQTETGGLMISALPGVTETKPGSAQKAIPGIDVDVVDERGESVKNGQAGYLVVRKPWPGMLRGIWNNPDRYYEAYWSTYKDMYFAGDGAKKDSEGDIWVLGRVDDVMNVSGHRLSTSEIESALVAHDTVAEAAVVGANDETTGQAVVAFAILNSEGQEQVSKSHDKAKLSNTLKKHVAHEISPIARPRHVILVPELPKTRSGKIMRRLLRDLADGKEVGDVTTLADPTVIDQIAEDLQKD
ncbi:MAG: acetate--CoA ligase [Micrococcaceae bacterium]